MNLGLGVALATGLVYSSIVVTKSMERMRSTIEVKGYAERKIKADYVSWTIQFTARNADLAQAYKTLEIYKDEILGFLKAGDVKDAKIDIGGVNKQTHYKGDENGRSTSDIGSFELTQTVTIASPDIDKIKELALKISALGAKGIEIEPRSPSYLIGREKLEKVKIELLAEATKSAKERADQFTLNSGTNIGRLISARQGVFQVTGEDSTEVDDYGTYDTSSIDKVVKIVVTLSYTTES